MAFRYPTGNRHSASPLGLTAFPLTLSCWYRYTTGNGGCVFGIGGSGGTASIRLNAAAATGAATIQTRSGGVSLSASTVNTVAADTWAHGCAVIGSTTDRRIYLNADDANKGSITTSQAFNSNLDRYTFGHAVENNSATGIATNCRVAQAAAWDVALDLADIEALADGFDPRFVRPDRLVFFAPCVREAIDIIQAATFTTTGTPVVEPHPIRIG